MTRIITITGQSLDDFIASKLPPVLRPIFIKRLEVLTSMGRKCIDAFVFSHENFYYFCLEDTQISEKAKVYISFIDVQNIIIIIDIVLI